MGFNFYSFEQYEKAIELKKKGYGSLRISKILCIKSRNAMDKSIKRKRYIIRVLAESKKRFKNIIGFSIKRKQERLINHLAKKENKKYGLEVTKMSDEVHNSDEDNHTVFVGSKPFMKFS